MQRIKVQDAQRIRESVEEFESLQQVAQAARRNLSRNVWDYLMGGSESETTLRRNRMGFDALAFRSRVLCDMREIDSSTQFLGHTLRIPVMLAPIGSLQLIEAGGAVTVARAAETFGVISFMSSVTQPGREEVGAATSHPKVFQLYVRGDEAWMDEQVKLAIDAGFTMFCLTVDTAHYSHRERDMIKRWVPSARRDRGPTGTEYQATMSWDLIRHFKDRHDIPLMLKGIATAEDAGIALEHGVEVIYVSNHGGRQLDHGRGAIQVLPEIIEAVAGRARVVLDGGILRGADVVKAMALGADAVAIGKLLGMALGAAGEAGVVRTLELLEQEIRTVLGNLGIHGWDELDGSYVDAARPAAPPLGTSTYQLIEPETAEL